MRHFLAFLALGIAAALQASVPTSSIDDFIAAEMPASGAPGLAYAVVENGEIRAGGFGETVLGSGREVTPDTPFALGSITKSFTGLAVMKLVEAGSLDLDSGIAQYLDAFSDRPSGAITARQLLSHTSGLSTVQGNDAHSDVSGRAANLADQVAKIAQWTPAYAPGEKWEYSNANYQLLGALIEAVSGKSYSSFVRAEILDPLGMENSYVDDIGADVNMAIGHTPWFNTKRPIAGGEINSAMTPAGGVIASANDVALYLAMMMNGEDDIVSAQSKAILMQPASELSFFYGLGWYIDNENGTVSHSGSTPGNETLATMKLSENKGVVVLVNGGSGIGFGETAGLRNGITARALGLDYDGEGGRWQQKILYLSMVLLPVFFLICIAWAWRHRTQLQEKRQSAFGQFSLWFPLLMTLGIAWSFYFLIPPLFAGGSMGTLELFLPDLAFVMKAAAITGVLWAVIRLVLAFGRKRTSQA